jgi:hypothetical protein
MEWPCQLLRNAEFLPLLLLLQLFEDRAILSAVVGAGAVCGPGEIVQAARPGHPADSGNLCGGRREKHEVGSNDP